MALSLLPRSGAKVDPTPGLWQEDFVNARRTWMHYRKGTEPSEAYGSASGNHIDVAHVARRAEVKTLVLTHMIPALDRPGVHEAIIAEMSAIFPGRLIWGEDLMEIPVRPDGPMLID
jgi:ribonuclease Z